MAVGSWIKQYRVQNNMSQEEFGKIVGVNKQTVSRWENETLEPAPGKLYEIADAINVSLYDILNTNVKEEDNLPLFSDNRKFLVGLNSVFEAIHDLPTLCVFIEMVSEIIKLYKSNESERSLLVNHSIFDDNADEYRIIVERYIVCSNHLKIESMIDERNEMGTITVGIKDVDKITSVMNVRNIFYVVEVKLKKDSIRLQLIFDLGDK